jgi:hypothetical protein
MALYTPPIGAGLIVHLVIATLSRIGRILAFGS